jgi:hypothetical protein
MEQISRDRRDTGSRSGTMNEQQIASKPATLALMHDDLARLGFAPEQIARLEALRDVYPVIEFVESNEQLQRLQFMKWRIARQQVRITV